MNEQKAFELLDLEPGASASEIRRAYQEIYNELQIRLTNAPIEHQKELYRKRLTAVEEAYLFLGGESEEDLSELPSMGPVETASEEKAQASKPMSEAAALELLGLSKPFSRGKLMDVYKEKKEDFERGFKSAPNKAIKDSFQQLLKELEIAFRLLEPLAESPAPPRPEPSKPQPEKKKASLLLWAIPVLLLLAVGIWFFLPKGEKQDEISQEVKEEFIKVKSQANLLAEKQHWDQALEKYQEAYALISDAEVQDSIKSINIRLDLGKKDNSNFKTVEVGEQVWMAENLNVDTFNNGDTIFHAKTAADWLKAGQEKIPAWCYFENNPTNYSLGKLYNWYAVNDTRGLAPEGWRIPNNNDWNVFYGLLKGNLEMMKIWHSYLNERGFSAVPSGSRYYANGGFTEIDSYWSASEANGQAAFLAWADLVSKRSRGPIWLGSKNNGFYVRCIQN